jgi:pyrimidine operon attenuation protein/uracil phosphoribosyltransferase
MDQGKLILTSNRIDLTIQRLCHHILENHLQPESLCIIGIQERGVYLADRLRKQLTIMLGTPSFAYGMLDITFYRDDFRRREVPIKAATTKIDFLVEDKNVILVDDVLYTGRTVHAAMTALQDFGRPNKIEMLCMVDRRFNRHFPIKADYFGIAVDALDHAYVRVRWKEKDGEDSVLLFSGKNDLT